MRGPVLVQNGQIAEITLQARSYEETAESGLVLPRLQAMAAMEAAGLEGRGAAAGISGQRRRNGHRPAGSPGERDRRGGRAVAWPKIKNIIILMLLVTNLCLLAFVGWREIRDWQLQDKALEQAVSFLAERGIQVDERIVPRSAELPAMGMERDLEEEQTLAAALLGDGLTPGGTQRRGLCL